MLTNFINKDAAITVKTEARQKYFMPFTDGAVEFQTLPRVTGHKNCIYLYSNRATVRVQLTRIFNNNTPKIQSKAAAFWERTKEGSGRRMLMYDEFIFGMFGLRQLCFRLQKIDLAGTSEQFPLSALCGSTLMKLLISFSECFGYYLLMRYI